MAINPFIRAGSLVLPVSMLALAGCGTTTASGTYDPALPASDQYPERLNTSGVGSSVVRVAGIRPNAQQSRVLLMDVVVQASDAELLEHVAARLEWAAADGREPVAELRADGQPVRIVGWRRAMHEGWWSLDHFSVQYVKARQPLQKSDGDAAYRESVTFMFETNAWELLQRATTVETRLRPKSFEQAGFEQLGVELNAEWTRIAVASMPAVEP